MLICLKMFCSYDDYFTKRESSSMLAADSSHFVPSISRLSSSPYFSHSLPVSSSLSDGRLAISAGGRCVRLGAVAFVSVRRPGAGHRPLDRRPPGRRSSSPCDCAPPSRPGLCGLPKVRDDLRKTPEAVTPCRADPAPPPVQRQCRGSDTTATATDAARDTTACYRGRQPGRHSRDAQCRSRGSSLPAWRYWHTM